MDEVRATRRRALLLPTLLAVQLLALACKASPPSDKEVSAQLERAMPAFQTLLKMLHEDPRVGTIGSGFLWETGKPYKSAEPAQLGVSSERLASYRKLFDDAGVARLDRSKDGEVQFLLWATGFAGRTQHKGITWSKQPLVSTENRRYTHLRDNWYLFQD